MRGPARRAETVGHGRLLGRTVNTMHGSPTEETGCYMEMTREGGRKEAKKPFRILLMLFWDEVREIPNLSKNCSGDFPFCGVASGPTRSPKRLLGGGERRRRQVAADEE